MPRNSDLVHKMYLKVVIGEVIPNTGSKFAWTRRLGHAIIDSIEVNIGGVTMDKQTGTWLDVWYELTRTRHSGYLALIGDVPELTNYDGSTKPEYTIYIPLQFWFNRHPGLSLPIISIQYHRIIFYIKFSNAKDCVITSKTFTEFSQLQILNTSLVVDNVYLDHTERMDFSLHGHEYLIEQVQFTGEEGGSEKSKYKYFLHFNYPTKELVWAMKNGNYTTGKKFLCYTNNNNRWDDAIQSAAESMITDSLMLLDQGLTPNTDSAIIMPSEEIFESAYHNNIVNWEEFKPNTSGYTQNGKIHVDNNNNTKSLWINTSSLWISNT